MPGPAKKPAQLKAVAGTVRPDREHHALEVQGFTEAPPPPDYLMSGMSVHFWNARAASMVAVGTLTELDLPFLANFVDLEAKLFQMKRAGEFPPQAMFSNYRLMAADLGLNPMSRQRFKPTEKTGTKNKFADARKA